jgi:hypothetical protein
MPMRRMRSTTSSVCFVIASLRTLSRCHSGMLKYPKILSGVGLRIEIAFRCHQMQLYMSCDGATQSRSWALTSKCLLPFVNEKSVLRTTSYVLSQK